MKTHPTLKTPRCLVKTPKLHLLDSGLLAVILGATEERIGKDRSVFGPLLETFAFAEVMKQVDWLAETCRLYHYRDNDQDEVDIIVEGEGGDVVGIAVKAASTVTAADFKGLRKLSAASGNDFFYFVCVGAVGAFNLFNSILAGIAVFIGGFALGHWVTNKRPSVPPNPGSYRTLPDAGYLERT